MELHFTNLLIVMAVGFLAPLALGFVPRLLVPSVVLEIVLGIVIGLLFGWAMQQALSDLGVSRLAIPWGLLVVFALIAALLGLVASIAPAIRASRIKVLEAISYE